MTKHMIVLGLLLGMSGVTAYAQTSSPASPDQTQPSSSQQQQATSPQQPASAAQAVSQVQQSLQKDPTLSQSAISVQTGSDNNLVLSGTVQSQSDKDRAEQVARASSEGMSIDNKIEVTPKSNGGADTLPPK